MFYKMFKQISPDLFELLTADINSNVNAHEITRDEIYSNRGNYLEIVGIGRRTNLLKRLLPTGKFDGLAYGQKIKFNKQSFSPNRRSLSLNKRVFSG